jgi:hypothetical protein
MSAFSRSRRAISRAIDRVTRSSGERSMRRKVSWTRWSGNTFRNGDCSSATASATSSVPSNTGSPVAFRKSASTIVSCSVKAVAPPRKTNGDAAASRPSTTTIAPGIQDRIGGRVLAALALGSCAAIDDADGWRLRGSGESARRITRSSSGSTSGTSADGRGGSPARADPLNGSCPTTSSYNNTPSA